MKTQAHIFESNFLSSEKIGFAYGMRIISARKIWGGIELLFEDGFRHAVEPYYEIDHLTVDECYTEKGIDLTGRYEKAIEL